MPFTFAHPAIVLPLLKKRNLFSATGLIIGSMTPDFESFILVMDYKIFGHKWSGVLWFDIPLGLMLIFLFHGIVRDPVIANLPRPLQERCWKYQGFEWGAYFRKHYIMIVTSLFIGIISHLLWDAFTHLNLRYPYARWSSVKVQGHLLYQVLQYTCSIIGLAVVAWAIYKMPRTKAPAGSGVKYMYWLSMALVAILLGTILITVVYKYVQIWPLLMLYIAISSCLGGLVSVSLVYTLFAKQKPN